MARRSGKAQRSKQAETTAIETKPSGSVPGSPPNPFALMRRFAEEMDRLYGDFRFGGAPQVPRLELPWKSRESGESAWLPSLEVTERGGKLIIRADVPGLTKDDVKVEVSDDVLRIEGERRQEREDKRKGVYRSERTYGRFYREVPLPEGVDPEQATASFKNGVLEVTMPAPPPAAKGRRVPVEEA